MKRYQVLNQMDIALIDNLTFSDALTFSRQYMESLYPTWTRFRNHFYVGDEHNKKNLRLKIQKQTPC